MTGRVFSVQRIASGLAILLLAGAEASGALPSVLVSPPAPLGAGAESAVLTNADQVHWLSREEAAAARHVLIRGVVTSAFPLFDAAVVQDATGGIYIDRWDKTLGAPPAIGAFVEVEGVTDPGEFAPRIHALRITRLGTRDLPPPVHPYWDQLVNGSLDTQFVEIEGVLTRVRAEGVTVLTHGGKLTALIFDTDGATNNLALKPDEGALVRLRGCLFASWNRATHNVDVSAIRMFAPSVTVVEPAPADTFAVTRKRVTDLLLFDPHASALRRVKVSGQLVCQREGEWFAMDGPNGFRFAPKEDENLAAGDLVEVVGFPSLAGPSPVLQEALARKVGVAPLPAPRLLESDHLFRAENDALRVRVNAVLVNFSGDQRTLELQSGLQRFVARVEGDSGGAGVRLPGAQSRGLDLPLGSRLELTGVYDGSGGNRTTGLQVGSFELLLHSPADIRVLMRPPFWTLPRLLVLVGALFGVLVVALVWIRLLRHQVQQRTAELRQEVQDREKAERQRALAQERARIARDLHDDLGSSLTEITMLSTAGPGHELPEDEAAERMTSIAGKSRTLVHALDEIVWAVDPARDTLSSVARYLASYAEEYLSSMKVACRVHIPNSFPEQVVVGEVRHHVFLAVKEALNNAVRHGGATEITFGLRVEHNQLYISIADNGAGFDTLERSNGHGLLNLRNRLKQLHGRCEVESKPGAGTTVSLALPLPAP